MRARVRREVRGHAAGVSLREILVLGSSGPPSGRLGNGKHRIFRLRSSTARFVLVEKFEWRGNGKTPSGILVERAGVLDSKTRTGHGSLPSSRPPWAKRRA